MNICFVSDFFHPSVGGVETHMYHLSQWLIKRGHKVIVITHHYKTRSGVRYLTNGLKVYHIPTTVVYAGTTFPTVYGLYALLRDIYIREEIDIVHGHQALSSMCQEAIILAGMMNIRTVFTDHSLFGFSDVSAILTNKLLKFALSDCNAVICVSNTSKENTTLRACLDPNTVYVIPNAIVSCDFQPDLQAGDAEKITIVVTSRLVYRKGIDLLVAVIPRICALHPSVHFIIAGDGPKRVSLDQMREQYMLESRVDLVGALSSKQVRDVLVKGHIFLNSSLTEAFCIAILEAASCGLLVVSTKVGGVPEVLPEDLIIFAQADEDELVSAVSRAIHLIQTNAIQSSSIHERVKSMYDWDDVAERTEKVYQETLQSPNSTIPEMFERYQRVGVLAGHLSVMVIAVGLMYLMILECIRPSCNIERAAELDLNQDAVYGRSSADKATDEDEVVCMHVFNVFISVVGTEVICPIIYGTSSIPLPWTSLIVEVEISSTSARSGRSKTGEFVMVIGHHHGPIRLRGWGALPTYSDVQVRNLLEQVFVAFLGYHLPRLEARELVDRLDIKRHKWLKDF
ncbi:phosphatidylinositol N-acetylglucosaminyltransferase [Synchytrium endobioticum]|uniref:Phosphatidylinositol N-acetylglucosaminyltransferase GPI3 subunit n=1 Tax=Synchytrium endobioticum TaxID=286115 RepID=A0A507D180_9FUNG|nr:phosphatidylinositol N-acetylglucosaminyltransferase [Synchytrium endobioticum]